MLILITLIWHFWSTRSVRNIEQIQIRALKMLRNNFDSDYKTILDRTGRGTMEVKRLRALGLKTFYEIFS